MATSRRDRRREALAACAASAGARQVRLPRLADQRPSPARTGAAGAGATSSRSELARVPAVAGGQHHACDFFTVETILLRRFYVLFFIARASRRVWLAGCTKNPTGEWVTQQARNLGLDFSGRGVRFLVRDRDSKYSGPLRRGLPQRRHPDRQGAGASTEGDPPPPPARPWRLRRPLYPREATSLARPEGRPCLKYHRRVAAAQSSTFTAATGSAASSTSTTKPPHDVRHEYWRPSPETPNPANPRDCTLVRTI